MKQIQIVVGQLIWITGELDTLQGSRGSFVIFANFPLGSLRFRINEPDYSNLIHKEYDWQRNVYSGTKQEVPLDIPEPKEKHVTKTTYVGANLQDVQVTGRGVKACLHLVNATPTHWHTKRQPTV